MFYAKSTGGFYRRDIHGDAVPSDAVEITDAKHAELLEGQANGLRIVADKKGFPTLVAPTPLTDEQLAAEADASRAAAYREEADPLFFKSQRGECSAEEWQAKIAEIRARFPKVQS